MKGYEYKDWMTQEERQRFVKNVKLQNINIEKYLNSEFISFGEFICDPFDWESSIEGEDYWYEISKRVEPLGQSFIENFKIGQIVYHQEIYNGNEPMKIVGIRRNELELQGDYSGGTHAICQSSWIPIKGVVLTKPLK